MDPKIFEQELSKIAQWQRVDEEKIYRRPDEVDPRHHNPQIEIVEVFKKLIPCDWCEKRMCTGRRTIQLADDPVNKKPVWKLYCNTCKCYFNPETRKLSYNKNDPDRNTVRGRPKKDPDNK